ncbi:MAG: cadherin repeat domain-containing protein, partial [Opitutae bacterium]|nr:cadherin repeat domain-containing protein [Opitutae bacterium]
YVPTPGTPDLAAASDSGVSDTDNLTSDTTPTFTGTAEANSTVRIYVDGNESGSGTADGSGNWSITTNALAAGAHSVTAKIWDAANSKLGNASDSLQITIDAASPAITSGATATAIDENSGAGQLVYTVASTDAVSITYSLKAAGDHAAFSIDGASGAVTLTGNPDYETKAGYAFTVVATDAAGNVSEQAVTLAVNEVNEAPVISGLPTSITVTEDTLSNVDLSAATFDDVDSGADSVNMLLTAGAGTLTAASSGGVTIGGSGSGSLTLTGTATSIDTYLKTVSNIQYTGAADANGNAATTLTLTANDGGDNVSLGTVDVNITPTNDAPVLDNSGTTTLTSITEDATDPAGDTVAAIIASAGDRITDVDNGAVEGVAITGMTGDGSWQYNTGAGWTAVEAVSGNSALLLTSANSLRFVPTAANNNAQTASITFRAWDQTSGTEGTKVDTTTNGGTTAFSTAMETAAISVTAVNDDPTISGLPASITVTEDTLSNVDLSAATFDDVDSGAGNVNMLLTAGAGTLTATSGGGVTIGGSGSGSLTLTGTAASIDTYLNTISNIQYTGAANANGNAATTLTLTANDGGNTGTGGGGNVSLGTVDVNITAVNDAPANNVPAAQTVALNNSLVFSDANANLITISDADIGNNPAQITLTASNGLLTLGAVTGLSFAVGDGNSDITMTFTGTLTDINTALNGLLFSPTSGFSGNASLTIDSNDLGGSGSGEAQTDSDMVAITVTPNTAPVITGGDTAAVSVAENTTAVTTVTATDADAGQTITYSLSGGADAAKFTIDGTTGALNFTAAPDFENPADDGANNTYIVEVTADDGNGGTGTQTITVTVTDVNEAPTAVNLTNATTTLAENTDTASRVKVADIVITDDALGANTVSLSGADAASFEVENGVLYLKAGTTLNYEAKTDYAVTVNVQDNTVGGSSPVSANFTLDVNNLDEVAPAITSDSTATAIDENSGAGQVVYTATSTDTSDIATGSTIYSLKAAGDHAAFSINSASGAITLTGNPDHETKPGYAFTVVATDAAGNASEQAVTLVVNDLDEAAPTITSGATATAIDENS